MTNNSEAIIFSGTSNPSFSNNVAKHLNTTIAHYGALCNVRCT